MAQSNGKQPLYPAVPQQQQAPLYNYSDPHAYPMLNEEEYQVRFCCSHFHAERAAYAIGIFVCVLSVLSLNPIGFALGICVVMAVRKEKPGLYLPYLILHVSPVDVRM